MANVTDSFMKEDKSMSSQNEMIMSEDNVLSESESSENICIADDSNDDKLSVSDYLISSEQSSNMRPASMPNGQTNDSIEIDDKTMTMIKDDQGDK